VIALASAPGIGPAQATPARAAEQCPNEALRTGPSAQLPDCRAYELTSPVLKNGFDVLSDSPRAARAGGGVVFAAMGAFPEASSAGLLTFYLSRRNPNGDGWTTKAVSPQLNPLGGPTTAPFFDWTADLSKAILQTPPNSPLSPESVPGAQDLYLRDNATDAFSLISHGPVPFEPKPTYGGASADFSHIVYTDQIPETAATPPTAANEVYEQVNGETRMVGILPNGDAVSGGVLFGSTAVGFGVPTREAVSDDGSRIVFSSLESENAPAGQIYVRVDGTSTVEASATQKTVPDPTQPATYWGATSDLSEVFFTSPSELTDDPNAGGANDLYRFDVDDEGLVDLTPDTSPGDANGADVQGVVGMSDDGSYVYFVAKGQLDGANGVAGAPNLYLWHDDSIQFIATLSFEDASANWKNFFEFGDPPIGSRVSATGTEALITTSSTQPGFDNVDPGTGEPHDEIYRFDATPAPSWTCVSCNPGGTPPTADATFSAPTDPLGGNQAPGYRDRALDSTHGTVFFNTAEALVEGDENGVTDAYEWRQGELSLISSGKSEFSSYFLDADASGDNVYVGSRDRLAPQDVDNLFDVYDARIGGGIPLPPAPPGCGAEPCRGPASGQGSATDPGSSTFVGPGNSESKPPPPRRRHRHRRHHRRRHHHAAGRSSRG
jgi:hypothetical protein